MTAWEIPTFCLLSVLPAPIVGPIGKVPVLGKNAAHFERARGRGDPGETLGEGSPLTFRRYCCVYRTSTFSQDRRASQHLRVPATKPCC